MNASAITLCGFLTSDERELCGNLIPVQGKQSSVSAILIRFGLNSSGIRSAYYNLFIPPRFIVINLLKYIAKQVLIAGESRRMLVVGCTETHLQYYPARTNSVTASPTRIWRNYLCNVGK